MYWLGGSSDTTISTLGSEGVTFGIAGRIAEKPRGGFCGGLGGRIAEKSNGPLVDVGTLGDRTGGDSLREHCCGFICLGLS